MASSPRRLVGSNSHLMSESSVKNIKRQKVVNHEFNIADESSLLLKSEGNNVFSLV